jgi:hypothetical protein
MNILVLGTFDRDVFGGIFDTTMTDMNEDELALMDAINQSFEDLGQNPCGSGCITGGFSGDIRTLPMPFDGHIDHEAVIYVEE